MVGLRRAQSSRRGSGTAVGKSRVFDRCRGWVFARPTGCRAVSTILLRADLSVLLFRGVARSARQVSHVCARSSDGRPKTLRLSIGHSGASPYQS